MKKCNTCGETKDFSEFSKDRTKLDGLRTQCKVCTKERDARYYKENLGKIKERKSKCYKENPTKHKKLSLKNKYDLTLEQAEEIYSRGCEVCSSKENLHIDHCHKTGRVRGCLCSNCNTALGLLKESPERIQGLKFYIEKFI